MSMLVRALFVFAGLVNLYPLIGVLGPERLGTLYGREFAEPGLVLLMRHRALLFGMLGVLLAGAAWRPSWRTPALVAGLASMLGFMALAGAPAWLDAPLRRVWFADLAASAALAAGWGLHRRLH